MLNELLPHLSPDTLIAMLADVESSEEAAFLSTSTGRRLFGILKAQLAAIVGDEEAEGLLSDNAINPYHGNEPINA